MKFLIGLVIKNCLDKTSIVLVKKYYKHKFYKKYIYKYKKYQVDDFFNLSKINDLVEIIYSKPISKKKY